MGIPTVEDRLLQRAVARILESVFEADIRGYFNHIQHDWLLKMVAHRIGDPVILRLIGKWLNAGFMSGGVVTRTEEGSPQGGPIPANIYLHYVLDSGLKRRSNHGVGEKYT